MSDPERIWLSPACDINTPDGRMWANPAPQAQCDDCDAPWVEYVRADRITQLEADRAELLYMLGRVRCGDVDVSDTAIIVGSSAREYWLAVSATLSRIGEDGK
jgi:hypothetical protein